MISAASRGQRRATGLQQTLGAFAASLADRVVGPTVVGMTLLAWTLASVAPTHAQEPILIPAVFEGDLIWLQVVTEGGDTLRLYTDTGGGLFMTSAAAERIGYAGGALFRDPHLNPPAIRDIPVYGGDVPPSFGDGMLGQAWFAGRTWTIDYGERKLLLHVRDDLPVADARRTVQLHLPVDSAGGAASAFGRIQAVIDGEALDFLLDTGAMAVLTDSARVVMSDTLPPLRATSFLARSVVERLLARHPDWRTIPNAEEGGGRMIEVPALTIANETIGPVWFTERPDDGFREYLAQWMDMPVDGALGGNVLRSFRVALSYPLRRAILVPTAERAPAAERGVER